MIVKTNKGFRVVSEKKDKSGKRRNLGEFPTKELAQARLRQVEYFKHKKG